MRKLTFVFALSVVFICVSMSWAGPTFPNNLTPQEASDKVEQHGAVILDVRTSPEYALIGHPKWKTGSTTYEATNIPFFFWGTHTGDIYNPNKVDQYMTNKYGQTIYYPRYGNRRSAKWFVADVEKAVPIKTTPVICMCRSGQRSCWAAYYLVEAGYSEVYNMFGGFEGDKYAGGDDDVDDTWKGQRRIVNGWQADDPNEPLYIGLPYGYTAGYKDEWLIR